MSGVAVSAAIKLDINDPVAKAVLIVIANAHNGKTGQCNPSRKRIASETSYSIGTVKKKLRWLAENGYLQIKKNFREVDGRQTTNQYALPFLADDSSSAEFTVSSPNVSGHTETPPPGPPQTPLMGTAGTPPLKEQENKPENELGSNMSTSENCKNDHFSATANSMFDELYSVFPLRPGSIKKEAREAFYLLPESDRKRCLEYAYRYKIDFDRRTKRSNKSKRESLNYVPFLKNWIGTGGWEHAACLPEDPNRNPAALLELKNLTSVNSQLHPELFKLCELLHNKPVSNGVGAWLFPNEIVAQAELALRSHSKEKE